MFEYSYSEIKSGCTQYTSDNMKDKITDAVYIKSTYPPAKGNLLIESLPLPRIEYEDYSKAYSNGIMIRENVNNDKNRLEKLLEIWALTNVRFPLPYHKLLEEEFYHTFLKTYERRNIFYHKNRGALVTINEEDTYQDLLTVHKKGSSIPGFSLIGMSGSGKSSSLEILTSHYPQAIRHHLEGKRQFVQITYINVECHTHGNMRAIYEGIGHAIDLALENYCPYYELQLSKKKDTLGEKEQVLRKLIEHFGIGIIILEEIQNMEFESINEKSFENFLTLCNDTGIGLVIVGTENARRKMFPTLRVANRIGIDIASSYIVNNSFRLQIGFVNELFKYQWFNEKVIPSDATVKKIVVNSRGIIGIMVRIYMAMCIDYVRAKGDKKPSIDENYVEYISQKYFPRIMELSNESIEIENAYFEEIGNLEAQKTHILNEESQKEESEKIGKTIEKVSEEAALKAFLIGSTIAIFSSKYSEEFLGEIIDEELAKGTFVNLDKEESLSVFGKILLSKLSQGGAQKASTDGKNNSKKDYEDMREEVNSTSCSTDDLLN